MVRLACAASSKGLKNVRIGAIGARPARFNTVRYSEKVSGGHGIDVETWTSPRFSGVSAMKDDDADAQAKLDGDPKYVPDGRDSRRGSAQDGQAGRGH